MNSLTQRNLYALEKAGLTSFSEEQMLRDLGPKNKFNLSEEEKEKISTMTPKQKKKFFKERMAES